MSTNFPKIMGIKIRRLNVSDLKPHPRNPRKHPEKGTAQWDTLVASLKYDYFDPLVWNVRNGMLVSGHLRTKVMISEGVEEVDVVEVDYDETVHLARLFAANKSIGEDDEEIRKEIFTELYALKDFNPSMAGYTFQEFKDLAFDVVIDPATLSGSRSDVKPAPAGPRDSAKLDSLISTCQQPAIIVGKGQTWRLGRHFLTCCSLLTGRFEQRLCDLRAEHEGTTTKVLFVPCPDPYAALIESEDVICYFVQPDQFVASHMATNFVRVHPDLLCAQV